MQSVIKDNLMDNNIEIKKKRKLDKEQFGLCKICNDKANGIHYGIPSCEGCKVIKYLFNIL